MKRYKILAMGVILAFLFGNTAVMAVPAIKKPAGSAASKVKAADGTITGITVTPANPEINKAIAVTVQGTITPGKQCSIIFLKGDGTPQSLVGHATSFPFKFGGVAYPLFVYSKAGTYTIKVYCGDGKCTGEAQAVVKVGLKMQSFPHDGAVPNKKPAGGAASPAKAAASSLVQTASKIEVKNFTAPVGKDITLEARLITSKGELLGGKMIEFKVNNKLVGSFPTAATGTANAGTAKAPFHVSGDYPPGTYKIEARFSGDATAGMGHGQGNLTVVKAQTKFEMGLIKSMNAPMIGGSAYLEGFLINTANPASEIKDRRVTVRANHNTFTETKITGKKGRFDFYPPIPLDLAALNSLDPKLPFEVEAEFGGDTYFEPTQAKFTFVAGAQPPPRIESAYVTNNHWLQLRGNHFKPVQYENDWNRWRTEYKNWVFIYADDGRGLKPVPLTSGNATDIYMRTIDLDTSSFNLQSIKFKVVRGRQESNIFSFSHTLKESEIRH